jgi:NTP pyrophosphatase (non-canonical NTP hydrolase)
MTRRYLTDRETDLLGLLQEECAEVIQAASKTRRFGFESVNPWLAPNDQKTNRTLLTDEIGDVLALVQLLVENQNIRQEEIDLRILWKRAKLIEYGYIAD